MNKKQEILIENDLYKLVTALYDSYKEDAKNQIKTAISEFAQKNNLSETEVLDKLNSLTKNRKAIYKSVDLTEWYEEKE